MIQPKKKRGKNDIILISLNLIMIKTTDSDFTLGIEVYEKEQGAVPIDI
jgi:hypothetical protein